MTLLNQSTVIFAEVIFAEMEPMQMILLFAAVLVGLLVLAFLIFFARYFSLWLQAYMSNARVSPFSLIGMGLRQVQSTGDR